MDSDLLTQKPHDIPLQEPHRLPEARVNGLQADFRGLHALMAKELGDHRQGHIWLPWAGFCEIGSVLLPHRIYHDTEILTNFIPGQ